MKKKNLKRAIVFTGCLLILLSIFEWTLEKGASYSNYSHFKKINLITEHKIDPQIAIFGSSVSEVGISPQILKSVTGLNAYNFSIDGTRYMQINGLIKEFGEYSKENKVVVLVEYFFTFNPVKQLTEVQRYLSHISNPNIYESLHEIQPELVWKLRYVPFYKFIAMNDQYYKASVMGWKEKWKGDEIFDSAAGYTPKEIQWDTSLDKVDKSLVENIEINEALVAEYRKTIDLLVGRGKKVFIVLPPIQQEGRKLVNHLDKLREVLRGFDKDNICFLDYSEIPLSSDKQLFYNYSHLNSSGSMIFSKILANDINARLPKAMNNLVTQSK